MPSLSDLPGPTACLIELRHIGQIAIIIIMIGTFFNLCISILIFVEILRKGGGGSSTQVGMVDWCCIV